jgi:hypothetical protein
MAVEKPKFAVVEDQDTEASDASESSLPPTEQIIDPPQGEPVTPITKPADADEVDLSQFEAKKTADIAGVVTLQTALPVFKPGEIKDYFRLHPGPEWWTSTAYCFIEVPIIGVKGSVLHLINEEVAVANMDADDFFRCRLVLGSKPYNVFFLCRVPCENLDNPWNETALLGCTEAKTKWVKVISEKKSGNERYKLKYTEDVDAFPNPEWPKQTRSKLVGATFKGRMVLTDKDPALARKIGRKIPIG